MVHLAARKSDWTIVQDMGPVSGYPLVAIQPDLRDAIAALMLATDNDRRPEFQRVITLFECYLQVTKQTLDVQGLGSAAFEKLADTFVGALESSSFFAATWQTRYNYRRLYVNLLFGLKDSGIDLYYIPEPPYSTGMLSLHTGRCIRMFQEMQIDAKLAWIWHGWNVTNLNSKKCWLYLYNLAQVFPKQFVDDYHAAANDYISGKRFGDTLFISLIADFTAQYPEATPAKLLESDFSQQFWENFASHYLTLATATVVPHGVVTIWYSHIIPFAQQYLAVCKLYAVPSQMPRPPKRRPIGGTKHLGLDKSGGVRVEKLLTYVPIHLSQTEAVDILFRRLQRDVDLTIQWADTEASKMWNAHCQRKIWESKGQPRQILKVGVNTGANWITDRHNPAHLMNAAATIASFGGYFTRQTAHGIANLLPKDLTQVAEELGFPTSYSLLPHMAILVNEHPEITPSFLEALRVYDYNGKFDGLIEDGSTWVLKSTKMRKGAVLAEQHIPLSSRAAEIVHQVLAITEAPRAFLRARKNKDWMALFITTGRAFGSPKAVNKISEASSNPYACTRRVAQFVEHTGIDSEEAHDLVQRLSLPALRASKGVLKYVETCSGPKMAEYIGHHAYNPTLLARYLPEPLRAFLQSRYVRVMQTGIIIEAMKDSPYLLEAASFTDEAELNLFLSNHVLNFPTNQPGAYDHTEPNQARSSESAGIERIVLNVDVNILTLYSSLELAMRTQSVSAAPFAIYWNKIGVRLMRFIEEKQNAEPHHFELLLTARARTDVTLVKAFFHG